MKEKKKLKWAGKLRPAVYLLPAAILVAVVLITLPLTAPVLRSLPEKLEYIMPVIAEASPVKTEKTKKKAEKTPEAFFDYKDGTYTGSAYGYGGDVQVEVTVKDGYIKDISILSAPGETEPYFTLAQSILPSIYEKQTWQIDVVSGATYSSRGILGAVQNAITGEVVENEHPAEENKTVDTETFQEPEAYKDGTYTGSAQGFGGTISVKVVIKDGKLADLRVVDASGETPEYYAQASAVVAAILKKGSPNVDTVSGATFSSSGIITAVKRALAKAGGTEAAEELSTKVTKETATKPASKKPAKKQKTKSQTDPVLYKDGTYTGSAQGFGGLIKVKVVIKKGVIKSVKVTEASDETPEYYAKAKAVIASILEEGSPEVDTVSGATFSSSGIIEAVQQALSKAETKAAKEKTKEKNKGKESSTKPPETTTQKPPETRKPVTAAHEDLSNTIFADGTFYGSGYGFGGEISVSVTVKKGVITSVNILRADDETPEFFEKAKTITVDMLTAQDSNVDVVSGATFSSEGIIEAVEQALLESAEKYKNEHGIKDETESQTTMAPQTATTTVPETTKAGKDEETTKEEITTAGGEETTSAEEETTSEQPAGRYKDGVYTGSAWCDGWPGVDFYYRVIATVTVENGQIVSVAMDTADDDSEYPEDNVAFIGYAQNGRTLRGVRYAGIPQQIIEKQQTEGVDIVSGATYSSRSMLQAVDEALAQAKN